MKRESSMHTVRPFPRRRQAGFSLVELMVAMLISLLLGSAAISLFVSNKRVYGATEGLGRLQENARMAFELMARDIREAGGNPCDVRMKLVNVVDSTDWWAVYDTGISGFDDGDHDDSVDGTDAIRIQYFERTNVETTGGMGSATGALPVNSTGGLAAKQILLACGFFSPSAVPVTDAVAIFSAGISANTLTHTTTDGNTSNEFSTVAHPTAVVFPAGASIGSLRAMEWYVGANSEGGTSLFRRQLAYPAGGPVMGDPEEIVPDVTDMQISYMEDGDWSVGLPTSWENVTAVQVELELEARDSRAGSADGELLRRKLVHVAALRNKL